MVTRTLKGMRTAVVAVAALGWWMGLSAQMTPANTTIANRASVSYSVGGLAQADIESSPGGNVNPGAGNGADTWFLVDNMINLSVSEVSGNATVVTPGMLNQVLAFTVANSGNTAQGYQLTVTEETGTTLAFGGQDNADFGLANLVVRVDDGDNVFDGGDVATAIDTLNPSQSVMVFVLANPMVPLTQINGNFVNVNLDARAAVAGTGGATLEVESLGVNDPTTVETLFADTNGRDGRENASDQFAVITAGLEISKSQTVLSDPFLSASPRAIPGAVVEYVITIDNSTGAAPADDVSLSDPIPADTTFVGTNVDLTGLAATACTADAGDGDNDGCSLDAGTLTVDQTLIGDIAAGATVTVAFQVTIN